jgi:hypothetical protein
MVEKVDVILLRVIQTMARNCKTAEGRKILQAKADEQAEKIRAAMVARGS